MTAATSNLARNGDRLVLAIDGGNSKADVALVGGDGRLLAAVRGPTISHQAVSIDEATRRLCAQLRLVAERAGRSSIDADAAVACLAGADYPEDVRLLRRFVSEASGRPDPLVLNDTFAALRAGANRPWGIALICGQGINGAAVGVDGRRVRFAGVGDIAGDWGGGTSVGMAGLAAAVRGQDGRGPRTALERTIPRAVGLRRPDAVTHAYYARRLDEARVGDLAPVVFRTAVEGDPVARAIIDRLADELVTMATALARRTGLVRREPEVVLGGGVFRTDDAEFHRRVRERIGGSIRGARVVRLVSPPVLGAALLGLDRIAPGGSAAATAADRARADFDAWSATARVEMTSQPERNRAACPQRRAMASFRQQSPSPESNVYDAPQMARPARELEPRTSPSAAGWIALAIWTGLAILALIAAVGVVTIFARMTDGLPPVANLDKLTFQQQSVIYDRTGKIELARFGGEQREVVAFADIPKIAIDAQTAVEDKTFWENAGFDPLAIISAGIDSLRGNSRGASTITQQLVRQRLLPPALVQDPSRTFERKVKEIVQSIRLTEAYPGVEGKQKIIAAYLNQNYYGNQSYGIKAAAKSYFGLDDLSKMTPAQAAILAGLPQSPSTYDLVKNADQQCKTPSPADTEDTCASGGSELVVKPDAKIVERRNQILELMANGRTPLSGDQYSPDQLRAAEHDPVILVPQATPNWIAPHFVWAVQSELADKLCAGEPTCDQLEAGGLSITTTLDADLQKIAERWVQAAAVVPNSKNPANLAKSLGIPGGYASWMKNLRGKDVHNGAMVAIDYQTGELVAYVGSANYYATKGTPQFQPKFDVVGSGFRQPGSAFKPFNYLTGIDDKTLTAATLLMDTSTDFGGKYTPADADNLERGPVRVRNALQFSLNIPAVKAALINEPTHVFARAQDFGMVFQTNQATAGAAIALGVQEVRPVDLVTAYGTLANGGKYLGHTTILAVKNQAGQDVIKPYQPPAGKQVAKPQSAFIVTDILSGNTNPRINPFWGKFELKGPGNKHRPATLKTGTNNDAKDLNAYGFIAPPTGDQRTAGQYALAVGAWVGNSDNSIVSTPQKPLFSIDVTTYMWQGFMQEATSKWAIDDFAAPDGLVKAKVDPFTGLKPSTGGPSIDEWFIKGTEPTQSVPDGMCGDQVLQSFGINEGKFPTWLKADSDWISRAERGAGVRGGVNRSATAFFYNGQFRPFGASWGALVSGHGCAAPSPSVTCYPVPTPDASGVVPSFEVPSADPSANIVFEPCPTPVPTPSASASEIPSTPPSATPPPSIQPTPTATPKPTKPPKPTPPPPTPTPPPPTPGPSSS